jgi:prepilin-type N-terminal cleavage/methylation domain-containing protein
LAILKLCIVRFSRISTRKVKQTRCAFSLLEVVAVVTIIGIVAAVVLARISGTAAGARKNACYVHKGNIEVQVRRWHRTKNSWPTLNLADIGLDEEYFPDGLPTCPVDGTTYSLNASTHKVSGHDHN